MFNVYKFGDLKLFKKSWPINKWYCRSDDLKSVAPLGSLIAVVSDEYNKDIDNVKATLKIYNGYCNLITSIKWYVTVDHMLALQWTDDIHLIAVFTNGCIRVYSAYGERIRSFYLNTFGPGTKNRLDPSLVILRCWSHGLIYINLVTLSLYIQKGFIESYDFVLELLDFSSTVSDLGILPFKEWNDNIVLFATCNGLYYIKMNILLQCKDEKTFESKLTIISPCHFNKITTHDYYNTLTCKHDTKPSINNTQLIKSTPHEVQSLSSSTRRYTVGLADSSPPEVRPAVSSSNYLSLKSRATPRDRGEISETIYGSRGEVNKKATTASGKESSTGPQVEPAADLREAEGEINREAVCKTTSDGTTSGKDDVDGKNVTSSGMGQYSDKKPHNIDNNPHNVDLPHNSPLEVTSTVGPTSVPPEVQSNSSSTRRGTPPPDVTATVPLAVEASSNYLPVNGKATPGDRGGEKGSDGSSIMGMMEDGAKDVLDVTSDGMKFSTGPRVETSSGIPAADLREAKGEVNREGTTPSGKTLGGDVRNVTSGGESSFGTLSNNDIIMCLYDNVRSYICLSNDSMLSSICYDGEFSILWELDYIGNEYYIIGNGIICVVKDDGIVILDGINEYKFDIIPLLIYNEIGNGIRLYTIDSIIYINIIHYQLQKEVEKLEKKLMIVTSGKEPGADLREAESSPPEVTALSSTRRGASSNYISLKGRATPGDRGEDSDGSSIMGMMEDGSKDVLDVTSSGSDLLGRTGILPGGTRSVNPEERVKDKDWTSSGIPVADLREAEGQLNRRADGRTKRDGLDLRWNGEWEEEVEKKINNNNLNMIIYNRILISIEDMVRTDINQLLSYGIIRIIKLLLSRDRYKLCIIICNLINININFILKYWLIKYIKYNKHLIDIELYNNIKYKLYKYINIIPYYIISFIIYNLNRYKLSYMFLINDEKCNIIQCKLLYHWNKLIDSINISINTGNPYLLYYIILKSINDNNHNEIINLYNNDNYKLLIKLFIHLNHINKNFKILQILYEYNNDLFNAGLNTFYQFHNFKTMKSNNRNSNVTPIPLGFPSEVTTSVPLASTQGPAVSSFNYLSLKRRATPGDRGDLYPEEQEMSTRKNVDNQPLRTGILPGGTGNVYPEEQSSIVVDVTSSGNGLLGRTGILPGGTRSVNPEERVKDKDWTSSGSGKPAADLREAEGQLNREAVCKTTSGGKLMSRRSYMDWTSSGKPESDLREFEGEINRRGITPSGTPSGRVEGIDWTSSGDVLSSLRLSTYNRSWLMYANGFFGTLSNKSKNMNDNFWYECINDQIKLIELQNKYNINNTNLSIIDTIHQLYKNGLIKEAQDIISIFKINPNQLYGCKISAFYESRNINELVNIAINEHNNIDIIIESLITLGATHAIDTVINTLDHNKKNQWINKLKKSNNNR